jgi:hypothetical protein
VDVAADVRGFLGLMVLGESVDVEAVPAFSLPLDFLGPFTGFSPSIVDSGSALFVPTLGFLSLSPLSRPSGSSPAFLRPFPSVQCTYASMGDLQVSVWHISRQ